MKHPIDRVHITQNFGLNPKVYKQFGLNGHNGIDYRTAFQDETPKGKRYITAALTGEVIEVGNQGNAGYGIFVRMKHGKAQTIYAHLTKSYVKVGDKLNEGDRLGLSGNTGFSTGPHLHFGFRPENWQEIYNDGFKGYVDPLPFIEKKHGCTHCPIHCV